MWRITEGMRGGRVDLQQEAVVFRPTQAPSWPRVGQRDFFTGGVRQARERPQRGRGSRSAGSASPAPSVVAPGALRRALCRLGMRHGNLVDKCFVLRISGDPTAQTVIDEGQMGFRGSVFNLLVQT